ncbi:MAG: DUF2934 domain-containing protein [Deltaproteobacteria bacterium]|jgi:hypothetical protein|nr:DUF2934 domain-containing protein [Deltaproteobacteria bacterium]
MATNFKTNKMKSVKPAPTPAVKPARASTRNEPTPEEIGIRAFEIYVSEGCPDGKDQEHWLRAEQELRSQGAR